MLVSSIQPVDNCRSPFQVDARSSDAPPAGTVKDLDNEHAAARKCGEAVEGKTGGGGGLARGVLGCHIRV